MLMPKRVKFRRMQRGRMTGKATRGNTVSYGEYGLMALEPGWVKSNQIEAARIAMTREALRLASHKLPIKTKIVARTEEAGE